MLIIVCPFCGARSEGEFVHGGPVRDRRPESPSDCTDKEWVEYLTVSSNPVGPVREKWWHVRGCGEWVIIERDTLTHATGYQQSDIHPTGHPDNFSDRSSDDTNADR